MQRLLRFLPWFQLPVAVLIALLQRTPALRVAVTAGEALAGSRAGQMLRSVFTLAALGGLHSRAGATTFVQSPGNPVHGTVGTPLSVAFTYTGTPSAPARFQVSGSLPAGLSYVPAPVGGVIRSGTPAIAGTPTQAGVFTISVQGFNAEGLTNNVQHQIMFDISAAQTGTAPAIASHPQSQSVTAGATVTFVVQASGSPAPSYQWRRDGTAIAGATTTTLTLNNVQTSDAGTYTVVVSNSAGSATSNAATLTVAPAGGGGVPPTIVAQPAGQAIASGGTAVFSVRANGATGYQWRRDGVALAGATGAMYVLRGATPADAGTYTVVVAGTGGATTTSGGATLSVSAGSDLTRLINLSIFATVTADDPTFTLGTVIGGGGTAGTKAWLVRAAGPALAQFSVPGALSDPRLDVFAAGIPAGSNDNWGGTIALGAVFGQVGAFPYLSGSSLDAALYAAAAPAGGYTIQIAGVGGAAGAVIAELYDASLAGTVGASTPRLVNVSVLKRIATGTTLSAGFVVGGGVAARTVLIRAIGPGLAAAPFGLPGTMVDPKLELYHEGTVIADNDNWGGDAQLNAVGTAVGAFAIADAASRDAMLLLTIAPGNYSAVVSGTGAGGSALVEVYEVP